MFIGTNHTCTDSENSVLPFGEDFDDITGRSSSKGTFLIDVVSKAMIQMGLSSKANV